MEDQYKIEKQGKTFAGLLLMHSAGTTLTFLA